MVQVVQLQGTDKQLYQLVAPLVMNPEVIKQNNNFPFRTSDDFQWFVAVDNKQVVGFMPIEFKRRECVINNYYIKGKQVDTLEAIINSVLTAIGSRHDISVVSFLEDKDVFAALGFVEVKTWTRYVKMKKDA